MDALEGFAPTQMEFEVRQIPIRQLRAGMVIERDISTTDGNLLILKKGTILNELWIERLANFANARSVPELVSARVPGPSAQSRVAEGVLS
jgi:hypothetical protein